MNLFDLYAKLTFDDSQYKSGIEGAKGTFSKLTTAVGNGLKTVAKVSGAALAAGTTAIAALGKASLEQYANYEQLVGGVETLFGAGGKSLEEYAQSVGKTVSAASAEYDKLMAAQTTVLQNADNAYMTAGMSANEYMETVTSFSASLLQGLGGDTAKAAEIANKAITDMSDNANKMGTDISMIQNAYQGFAKQNYTMLDNLKLGYGGTQAEMARLVNDSGVLADGITVDAKSINTVSFDKIIEAIGVIQDRMGITGTTSREAATTIQGSISMMKSAWTNLLTGLANEEADLDKLVDNLVNSAVTVAGNVGPRLLKILPNIGKGLKSLAKKLAPELSKFVEENGPPLLDAATELIEDLVEEIPDLLDKAVSALPSLLKAAGSILGKLGSALLNSAPKLLKSLQNMLDNVDWEQFGRDVYNWFANIDWDGPNGIIQQVFQLIGKAFASFGSFLWGLFKTGFEDLKRDFEAWKNDPGNEGRAAGEYIIEALAEGLGDVAQWTYDNIIAPLVAGLTGKNLEEVRNAGVGLGDSLRDGISSAFGIGETVTIDGEEISIPSAGLNPIDINTSFGKWLIDVLKLEDISPDWIAWIFSDNPSKYFNGSHANGLSYVPYDGYIAELHQGERVLTRREASQYRNNHGGNTYNININGARYMDEESLAQRISELIQFETEKEAAAFG